MTDWTQLEKDMEASTPLCAKSSHNASVQPSIAALTAFRKAEDQAQ